MTRWHASARHAGVSRASSIGCSPAALGLVLPLGAERGWDAPWQREVRRVSDAWLAAAVAEPRLRPVDVVAHRGRSEARTDVELRFFQRV